jgi:hypothetical protein
VRLLGGAVDEDEHDKVCTVTGSGEHTLSRGDLVARASVVGELSLLCFPAWHQVNEWRRHIKNFGI